MPSKLTTILSAALLAATPMIAHAQLGGRVGGAVGGTVGGSAGLGAGGINSGVNGSSSVGIDDRAGVNARRLHSDATAAGRADARTGAQVTTPQVSAPSAGVSAGANNSNARAGAQVNTPQVTAPSAGVAAGAQTSGGGSASTRVEGR